MGGSQSAPQEPYKAKIIWFPEFEENLPSLEGKTVAITGCTTGTGFVAARTSVRKGAAAVLLLNRPSERAEKAEADIKAEIPIDGSTKVETIPCDLQSFESVRQAAALIKSKYEAIDVLCNNAGVMAIDDMATVDGYDVQMQTNHLSHFLLTKELYPLLKRAKELRGEARVVHHSSSARRMTGVPLQEQYLGKNGGNLGGNGSSMLFGGAKWQRYHQTKLANSVMTLALKDRFGDSGIKAAVAAPGLANTNLQVTTQQNGGAMSGGMWVMKYAQSAEDGTMPLLAACFDPSTENGDFWEPGKMMNQYGPAVKVPYDKLSADPEARKILWEKSEEACGEFKMD